VADASQGRQLEIYRSLTMHKKSTIWISERIASGENRWKRKRKTVAHWLLLACLTSPCRTLFPLLRIKRPMMHLYKMTETTNITTTASCQRI